MKNILSIDLESWIHFYEDALKIKKLSSLERKKGDNHYIEVVLKKILDLLDAYNQKATFFIVSEIDEWYPESIQEIKKRGHEIGYHTHTHSLLRNADILERELLLSKKFIRKFKPKGFRAPQIYLTKDATAHLENHGFTYSSSTYDDYALVQYGELTEIPVSAISYRKKILEKSLPKQLTFKMLFNKLPFGSGLFIALFGTNISKQINKLNKKGIPAIIFIHPWQMYQPNEIKSLKFKLRILLKNPLCLPYTRNILRSMGNLFKQYQFTSFQQYYHGQRTILG